jgi:hypothetical protein
MDKIANSAPLLTMMRQKCYIRKGLRALVDKDDGLYTGCPTSFVNK